MIIKITAISICGIFCVLILKDKNPQAAFAVSVTVSIAVLSSALPTLSDVFALLKNYAGLTGLDGDIFSVLFKTVIIAVTTRVTAELCRDNGERAVGAQVELAGTAIGMLCAMPLVDKALNLIGAL